MMLFFSLSLLLSSLWLGLRSNFFLSWLSFFLNLSGNLSWHSSSHIGGLLESIGALTDLKIFFGNLVSIFALKVDTDFIVDETDDHTVVERDERRRLMILHLLLALHEDEGTIGRCLILARLRDEPSLALIVSDIAVIS